jgi:hypothetical protein
MTEEINIEELKNIKNWYLDDLVEHPSKLEHVLETIVSVVLSQQEQIKKLEKFVSVLRQRELDKTAEKLDRYYRGLDHDGI